jgi:hypothetical protein
MTSNIYSNPNRLNKNSSQQENVILNQYDNYIHLNSYQCFNIGSSILEPIDEQLKLKHNILQPIINDYSIYNTFIDIGASNGYFTFLANNSGFTETSALEHDSEYTNAITIIKNKLNFENIKILNKKFKDIDFGKKYNVVCMLALIHWIYCCTEINGCFDVILEKLSNITENILIIEWIDKDDPAIKIMNHITYNNEFITEMYCEQNFINSINKYFYSYYVLPPYKLTTRKIYIVFKNFTDDIRKTSMLIKNEKQFYKIFPHNSLDRGTSDIFITKDKSYIMKKINHYIEHYVYERELFWLEKLKDETFIPRLVYKDDINKIIITTYFGDRIDVNNKPKNWEEQLTNILKILQDKYKWDNPDLKRTEILVSNEGKLGIVDFGWCRLNQSYECGLGFTNTKYVDPPINNIFEQLIMLFDI